MDSFLAKLVDDCTVKMNPDIVNGIAVKHIQYAETYLNNIIASAAKSFPDGLEYTGCERTTPTEEFNEVTRVRNGKRLYDVARSDLYMIKLYFRFDGKDLPPRYIYLPYVSDGGLMFLSGSRFSMSPVLTDRVISPGINTVFVRLLRDKIIFERLNHSININGLRKQTQVIHAAIYRKSAELKKMQQTTKASTCLVHYLLAKYGWTGMFSKFTGYTPQVFGHDIDLSAYPPSEYVVLSSSKLKPKTFMGQFYTPSDINIVVPLEHWTDTMQALMAGVFYVIDHFPSRISAAHMDNTTLWCVLLGHIIFSGVYGEGRLYEDIQQHFNSLDEYIDTLVVIKLKEIGYDCTDFYDLLVLVIVNHSKWIIEGGDNTHSLYGKELSVLYHVLFDITASIFRTGFRLNKIASKKPAGKKALSEKEIIETMNKNIRLGRIFSITSGHINMATSAYSGDNKFFKFTSVMVPQANASNKTTRTKTSKASDGDPSKRLHVSIADVGSFLNLPKTNPSGAARISPYITLDKNGVVMRSERNRELLDSVALALKSK